MADSINLGDDSIWDDSALVKSWDDALNEYKRYHSIHARGENVEEIIRNLDSSRAESAGDAGSAESQRKAEGLTNISREANEVRTASDLVSEGVWRALSRLSGELGVEHPHDQLENGKRNILEPRTTSIPDSLLATVPDNALKNLMMAWYYAGYYTGLQEAGQRHRTSSETHDEKPKNGAGGP